MRRPLTCVDGTGSIWRRSTIQIEVWGHGAVGREAVARFGGRERQVEEVAGRADAPLSGHSFRMPCRAMDNAMLRDINSKNGDGETLFGCQWMRLSIDAPLVQEKWTAVQAPLATVREQWSSV